MKNKDQLDFTAFNKAVQKNLEERVAKAGSLDKLIMKETEMVNLDSAAKFAQGMLMGVRLAVGKKQLSSEALEAELEEIKTSLRSL